MRFPHYDPDQIRSAKNWDGSWPEPGKLYRFKWQRDGTVVKAMLGAGEITLTPYTYVIAAFPDELPPDPVFQANETVH